LFSPGFTPPAACVAAPFTLHLLASAFGVFAADDAVELLRGLKVGQKVKVKGKLEFTPSGREQVLRLYACSFADAP
jgi:hypothetical protein